MAVRPHPCYRCGAEIPAGEPFAAVDLLDPEGELSIMLCQDCAATLRAFLDGEPE